MKPRSPDVAQRNPGSVPHRPPDSGSASLHPGYGYYCPLARFLSLMPWNRRAPFSLDVLRRTVFSPPVRGNILQGLPAD